MWECNYGSEPIDLKLLTLKFIKKSWMVLVAAILGVLVVGGPYFLKHVTFGPAKEYQAVTDFYMDYATGSDGTEYTYFNQTTWTQLMQDDVFTDKIIGYLQQDNGVTLEKEVLKPYLYATMLSDTRIVTTTVATNSPELTMQIEQALLKAMQDFGAEQKEIATIRVLQMPEKAELVIADVRTFRACMLGLTIFVLFTLLGMLCYFVLDDSIDVPITFERRYHLPMAGLEGEEETEKLLKVLCKDKKVEHIDVADIDVETLKDLENVVLRVNAGAHNGKQIENALSLCAKCEVHVLAAVLLNGDKKLINRYQRALHPLCLHNKKG